VTQQSVGIPAILSRLGGKKKLGVEEFFSIELRSSDSLLIRTWTVEEGVESLVEEVVKTFSDRGLPGAKTFKAAALLAQNEYLRLLKQKQKQGYALSGEEEQGGVDFDQFLPSFIRTPKPIESISQSALVALCESGFARFSVKYDGIGLAIVHHSFGWEFYSLSGNRLTEKFPLHLEWFAASSFGVGTIIKAEAVLFTGESEWSIDFQRMNGRFSLATSTQETRAMIESGELPEPCFVLYDILYCDGEELSDTSYDSRRAMLGGLPPARFGSEIVAIAELVDLAPDTWEQAQVDMRIEGFVLVDGRAVLGEKVISFSSSPGRPKGHYKLKPYPSEDVVVYAARVVNGVPESVFIKQRYQFSANDPKGHCRAGEWFACGRVSLHRNPDLIQRINSLIEAGTIVSVATNKEGEALPVANDSGVTVVINFESRLPSNKFRHGVFSKPHRFRDDSGSADFKAPSECFANWLVDSNT
jgi:ATP-dependent DNA ligase